MLKYGKISNQETKECEVGVGNDIGFYKSIGFQELDVEEAYNGQWYLVGYAPKKPEETALEKLNRLEFEYQMNRWQREAILADGSLYSDYTKQKAQELEDLAKELRK